MKYTVLALAGVLAATSAGHAQTAATPPIGVEAAVLRTGTSVPLKLRETLTTKGKTLRVGQRFQLEVAEAVLVNGQPVIPAGAPAVGEVTEVRNKGMWGKSGHLTAQVLYVTINGRQVKLNGTFDDKGTTGTAGVVGAIAFVPVAGFLMTGTSATVPVGAPVNAFIGEDVPLNFASAAPVPIAVPAASPPVGTDASAKLTPISAVVPAK